jgi:hypothetical protein
MLITNAALDMTAQIQAAADYGVSQGISYD